MRIRSAPLAGFTLVELLIGVSLGGLVMAALLSAMVYFARNFARLAQAQALEEQSRLALAWLRHDVGRALAVKPGSAPSSTAVTLVLPEGEVTYAFDATARELRRQATFGGNADLTLLRNRYTQCTDLSFSYYTNSLGPATDPLAPDVNVPYSIKQLRLAFTLETPAVHAPELRMRREIVSSRYVLRQRTAPDGS